MQIILNYFQKVMNGIKRSILSTCSFIESVGGIRESSVSEKGQAKKRASKMLAQNRD